MAASAEIGANGILVLEQVLPLALDGDAAVEAMLAVVPQLDAQLKQYAKDTK